MEKRMAVTAVMVRDVANAEYKDAFASYACQRDQSQDLETYLIRKGVCQQVQESLTAILTVVELLLLPLGQQGEEIHDAPLPTRAGAS